MKTTFLTSLFVLGVGYLCHSQSNESKLQKQTLKAERVESNSNPLPKTVELPYDFPVINFDGHPEENFYDFIQEKAAWYDKNPEYLKKRIGLTRVSKSFIEGLTQEMKDFIEAHKEQFEVLEQ